MLTTRHSHCLWSVRGGYCPPHPFQNRNAPPTLPTNPPCPPRATLGRKAVPKSDRKGRRPRKLQERSKFNHASPLFEPAAAENFHNPSEHSVPRFSRNLGAADPAVHCHHIDSRQHSRRQHAGGASQGGEKSSTTASHRSTRTVFAPTSAPQDSRRWLPRTARESKAWMGHGGRVAIT